MGIRSQTTTSWLPINRMTELQGAVALAQIDKVDGVVESRIRTATMLTELIKNIPGVSPPELTPNSKTRLLEISLRIDDASSREASTFLRPNSKSAASSAILVTFRSQPSCARCCATEIPLAIAASLFEGEHRSDDPPIVYDPKDYPGTFEALSHIVVLPWNEFYNKEHVNYIAENIREVAKTLKR